MTMRIVYEVIKVFFGGITIVLGLLYRKGSMLFDADTLRILKQLILPGYIVLCGVMLGYILYRGRAYENPNHEKTALNTFLMGCLFGVVGALLFIFTH